jgi:hypothetical protein
MKEKLAAAVAQKFLDRQPIPEEELHNELEYFTKEDNLIPGAPHIPDLTNNDVDYSDDEDDIELPSVVINESTEELTGVHFIEPDYVQEEELKLPLKSYDDMHNRLAGMTVSHNSDITGNGVNLSQVSFIYFINF